MANYDILNSDLTPFVIESIKKTGSIIKKYSITITVNNVLGNTPVIQASELVKYIEGINKIPLKELKYFDLLFSDDFCNGIYVFTNNNKVYYVGKSTSRAIVDRIGSHLDLRQSGFLNCLVKRIALKAVNGKRLNSITTHLILTHATPEFGNLSLCYLPVKGNKKQIPFLEEAMIAELQPQMQNDYATRLQRRYNKIIIK